LVCPRCGPKRALVRDNAKAAELRGVLAQRAAAGLQGT
jgi:alpha-L-fucosidase